MRNFDFTPLWRSTVGFEGLFHLMEESLRQTETDPYPPYSVERTGENEYRVSLALAGFTPDEITVTATPNLLTVEGRNGVGEAKEYLHHGISARSFKRQFNLADYIEVKHAAFENGMLEIELVRELPESMKPRRIEVTTSLQANDDKQIDTKMWRERSPAIPSRRSRDTT
jgi:molecular chaperone IbpA